MAVRLQELGAIFGMAQPNMGRCIAEILYTGLCKPPEGHNQEAIPLFPAVEGETPTRFLFYLARRLLDEICEV
jgi:hypothetical protein